METLKTGDKIECVHCGCQQCDPVEDHALFELGSSAEGECEDCGESFWVERITESSFGVTFYE